jgi:hypothetical protein
MNDILERNISSQTLAVKEVFTKIVWDRKGMEKLFKTDQVYSLKPELWTGIARCRYSLFLRHPNVYSYLRNIH